MTRAQRIVLIVYFLLLAYCCEWVPWHLVEGEARVRDGYGWLWVGPSNSADAYLTTPDWTIIALRIVAVTAIAGAAYLAVSMKVRRPNPPC
jgi:hypothetical protein